MVKCVCDRAEKWAKSAGPQKPDITPTFRDQLNTRDSKGKNLYGLTHTAIEDKKGGPKAVAGMGKSADAKGGGGAEMGTTAPKPTKAKQMPKPAPNLPDNTMKSEGAHGHCLGCNCVEKALPSMANFQSLATHPTAKPQPGAGAKPSAPAAVKVPGKGPADHVLDASHANKEIGSFQSLAKPVKKGLPGAHLFPAKVGKSLGEDSDLAKGLGANLHEKHSKAYESHVQGMDPKNPQHQYKAAGLAHSAHFSAQTGPMQRKYKDLYHSHTSTADNLHVSNAKAEAHGQKSGA